MEEKLQFVKHFENELPSSYANRLGLLYASMVTNDHKKDNGQFFTPLSIANFMASFGKTEKEKIKILDPGCGIGILSTAITEALLKKSKNLKIIELVAFETDTQILQYSELCLEYLRLWLSKQNIEFTFFLCKNDFVLHNSSILNNHNNLEEYDIVISNPPYFKLPKNDERIKIAQSVIYGQSNIYSIFLIISAKLLKENGQLLLITPRSFCSGSYFRVFRETFFSLVDLKTIHLFNSRKSAFKKDNVLQENLIIEASRKKAVEENQTSLSLSFESKLTISSSETIEDIDKRKINHYDISNIINFNSYQKILHLPLNKTDQKIIKIFKNWTGSLKLYGLEISTGPVVDFRSLEWIKPKSSQKTVPLFWLHNVYSMNLIWPRNSGNKGKIKCQHIIIDKTSISRLVKNKNCILVRRFSTKDDNRRLIAAPYFKNLFTDKEFIGIENHLNYIYHKEQDLTSDIMLGLSALLNSKIFDLYFRTFNGNINVSATELRDFPLPDFDLIKKIGNKIENSIESNKEYNIDELVSEVFNLKIDLSKVYE
ncbi:Eco57I restriction-modification methylase domain-containing protein [Flavobacterium anhuiense]|uniref:Eco57I restriction-modification methylase domain-containing protein n=1 Tax=Flavobacterium anhuiense TaxID=459526 RepID=UPI002026DAF2|nr:Eco57I restriction-modification methylase domain-containing protein [Flavobacterium anhuiense]URM35636.1 Eco57I restriction-modification methylase domain-containing protein [Flavobacterium anhuiense]